MRWQPERKIKNQLEGDFPVYKNTLAHLAVGHDNVHNALLYEVHFCTDRALLYDNITCRYPKISLNSTQMKR